MTFEDQQKIEQKIRKCVAKIEFLQRELVRDKELSELFEKQKKAYQAALADKSIKVVNKADYFKENREKTIITNC